MIRGSEEMLTAAPLIPVRPSIDRLRAAAKSCRACPLWRPATQTVFGRGPARARAMLIGEQPGAQEDLAGLPFVGPAGKLLDRALAEAGVPRRGLYLTNAVKHFKFEPRGKVRLHKRANASEQAACRPWLEKELEVIEPEFLVCLGASAAQSLLGPSFRITKERGKILKSDWAPALMATYHPSAILRAPDPDARHAMRKLFIADLRKIARRLA